jgi:hypothetical protein
MGQQGGRKFISRERIGRNIGKVRRAVNSALEQARARVGGGGAPTERIRDIFRRRA